MLTIHHLGTSQSERILWLCEELGIAYEAVQVSIKDGEHRKADFLRINPKARVPALSVDGKILTENVAILTYLGGGFAERGMWPRETFKQAEALALMSWLSSSVHIAVAGMWRPERYSGDSAAHQSIVAHGKETVLKQYAEIEKMLTAKTWVMGSQFTVCDPYLLVFYRWGYRMGMDMKATYPNWAKHATRIFSRATVKRVFEDEGFELDK